MADDINNAINNSIADYVNTMSGDSDSVLRSIDLTLKAIARPDGISISQSSLQDLASELEGNLSVPNSNNRSNNRQNRQTASSRSDNQNVYNRNRDRFDTNDLRRRSKISADKFFDKLTDSLEDEFIETLMGSAHPIQDALKEPIAQFANSLGVNVNDLSKEVGKRLGQQVGNAFKNSPLGQQLTKEWQGLANMLTKTGSNILGNAADFLNNPESLSNLLNPGQQSAERMSDLAEDSIDAASNAINSMAGNIIGANGDISDFVNVTELSEAGLSTFTEGLSSGTDIMASLMANTSSVAAAFPVFTALIGAGILALNVFEKAVENVVKNFENVGKRVDKMSSRLQSQYSKNSELSQQRVEADMKSLIKIPFDILEDAANKALDTWDNVYRTVTATQGYDKAGLQDLWKSYAQRLQEEGLDSVISSADMMSNLENVLKSGLSGDAAEEFAYIATVLNNAIPTQDFFQYADTYASLAANAVKNGASETEAIESANEALKAFASNLIYANREIAGGLTTSLNNASSLFENAAKISVTSRGSGSISEISGVLTSASAIVGSIAPDLANGVVDAVVKAAIGGNSNEITALRAMTSAGASNTAFLQALAKDPQKLFAELFTNLANLQNMSADNFMEVAEGLSSVFGLSMDAFARVDFNYLAKAISEMNVNSSSLEENMELLRTGQTTLTAEQKRMEQINKYMIDEGLAYVLDNEVAREVQRHMWEEQLAREIEESLYAVEVHGTLLDLVQGILNTLNDFLESKGLPTFNLEAASIGLTALQSAQLSKDIANVLDAQLVGTGRDIDRYNLLTSNETLDLIAKYPELIGLDSNYNSVGGGIRDILSRLGLVRSSSDSNSGGGKSNTSKSTRGNKFYNWNLVSKTEGAAVSGDWRTGSSYNAIWDSILGLAGQLTSDTDKVQEFLDTIPQYTSDMIAAASAGGTSAQNISTAREESTNKYLTQAELEDLIWNSPRTDEERSFDKWVEGALDYGIYNLGQTLSDYGLTLEDIKYNFQQAQTRAEAKTERARQLHEVQFWENVEEYNNNYFPNHFENEFLRRDWMENWEITFLTPIRDDLHQLLEDWEDYYIHHTAYTDATANAFESAIELADLEKDEMGDSVLALAKALTENNNWLQENQEILKDPVVHANVLLSQILVVTEAIMQQNNNVATTSAIPTTLLGLSTGGVYE